ncbi:hypothetical protein [Lactococcus lactis]|uniref:hypothetical protein n=1 Tax=Lactococcus lactis TaxID=1358 RepID=UPI00071E0353|nr:hypothetical protein [Lactococcus lactis]KST90288.1 hypothetical protein LKF24_2033 [Lactococcus lactis subsp. lactis]
MTEIEKVTNNQAKARSIYNSLIKDNIFYTGISKNLAIALIELGIDSSATDKLSVEKLQEIRVEELKDFNSKILQAELKNQKLQKEIDAAKKYIEESYKADKEDNKLLDLIIEAVAKLKSDNETLKKALTESEEKYQKQMDRFLNSEMNESARSHCESQLKLLFPAHKAYEALAAIGGDDE